MNPPLPLESMTTAEKLSAMEAIWESLGRIPEELASPEWHGEVLRERQARAEAGEGSLVDWAEAKKRLRNECR